MSESRNGEGKQENAGGDQTTHKNGNPIISDVSKNYSGDADKKDNDDSNSSKIREGEEGVAPASEEVEAINVGQMKAVLYVKVSDAQLKEMADGKAIYEAAKIRYGQAHSATLKLLYKLGDLYYGAYQWADSEGCYRAAWLGFDRCKGFFIYENPDLGINYLNNSNNNSSNENNSSSTNTAEGDPINPPSRFSTEYMAPLDSRKVFEVQTKLAHSLLQLRRYSESFFHYKQALDGFERIYGVDGKECIVCIDGLGQTSFILEDLVTSEIYFERLLDWYNSHYGPMDSRTLYAISKLAIIYKDRNRLDEAEKISRKCYDDCISIVGIEHPTTQSCAIILAFIKHLQGESEEALRMYEFSLKCVVEALGEYHGDTIGIMCKIARLFQDMKRFYEAEHMHRRAYAAYCLTLGETHPKSLEECRQIAVTNLIQEDLMEAEEFALKSIEGNIDFYGDNQPKTLESYFTLAKVLQAQSEWIHSKDFANKLTDAIEVYNRVHENRLLICGPSDIDTLESASVFASMLYKAAQKGNNDAVVQTQYIQKAEELFEFVLVYSYEKSGLFHSFFSEAAYYLAAIRLKRNSFENSSELILLSFMSFLCFYFNNLLKKIISSSKKTDKPLIDVINTIFADVVSHIPVDFSCPMHRLVLLNNLNGVVPKSVQLNYIAELPTKIPNISGSTEPLSSDAVNESKSRGESSSANDNDNSNNNDDNNSDIALSDTLYKKSDQNLSTKPSKPLSLAANEMGLYNLNISLLEEYMYTMTQRRHYNETALQFNAKEEAIKRMFINSSVNPANVNVRQYSTLNNTFKDNNNMGDNIDDIKRRETFNSSLGISKKMSSFRTSYTKSTFARSLHNTNVVNKSSTGGNFKDYSNSSSSYGGGDGVDMKSNGLSDDGKTFNLGRTSIQILGGSGGESSIRAANKLGNGIVNGSQAVDKGANFTSTTPLLCSNSSTAALEPFFESSNGIDSYSTNNVNSIGIVSIDKDANNNSFINTATSSFDASFTSDNTKKSSSFTTYKPKNDIRDPNSSAAKIERLEESFLVKITSFYSSLQTLEYQVLCNPSPPLRSIREKTRIKSYGKSFQRLRLSSSVCSSIQEPCSTLWSEWIEYSITIVDKFISDYAGLSDCVLDVESTVYSHNQSIKASITDLQAFHTNASSRFNK